METIGSPEAQSTPETAQHVDRQLVVDAFSKLSAEVKDPRELDYRSPDVLAANKLLDSWSSEVMTEAMADQDPRGPLANFDFQRATVFIDAGFTDPAYVRHVITGLERDHEDVLAQNTPNAGPLMARIAEKIGHLEPMAAPYQSPTSETPNNSL